MQLKNASGKEAYVSLIAASLPPPVLRDGSVSSGKQRDAVQAKERRRDAVGKHVFLIIILLFAIKRSDQT